MFFLGVMFFVLPRACVRRPCRTIRPAIFAVLIVGALATVVRIAARICAVIGRATVPSMTAGSVSIGKPGDQHQTANDEYTCSLVHCL